VARNGLFQATLARKALFRRFDRVGSSHMHPHAIQPQAEQPLLLVGAIEHSLSARIHRMAHRRTSRRHDRDTRIDERNHLMFLALAQRAIGQHRVIAASAIADAARVAAISSRISMRAGSKVSASRARLGRTPSIHSVSR